MLEIAVAKAIPAIPTDGLEHELTREMTSFELRHALAPLRPKLSRRPYWEVCKQSRRNPIRLPFGETRLVLEDGDEMIMLARCHRDGFVTISFGECRGTVLPSAQR